MISQLVAVVAFLTVILSSPGIIDILGFLSDIAAPIVTALVGIILWLHRRVAELEESKTRHNASLYGTESDQLQRGVIREVKKVDARLEDQSKRLEKIEKRLDQNLDEDDD